MLDRTKIYYDAWVNPHTNRINVREFRLESTEGDADSWRQYSFPDGSRLDYSVFSHAGTPKSYGLFERPYEAVAALCFAARNELERAQANFDRVDSAYEAWIREVNGYNEPDRED